MYKINKALNQSIEWIRNDPYTEEIINISEVELLNSGERIVVSEIQGEYPADVKFTAMQKVEVTYRNNNRVFKATIIAGFDAVRYKKCMNDMYKGEYLSYETISVEFIGEYSKVSDIIEIK